MKEAEEIIISKRFFELTPSELEAVKEFAANEEDYEAMKWFLQQTKTSFAEEKIEASSNLRAGVMAHLNQQPSGKTIWLNGVGAFLFPSQKKFYQYPAFQIAAVALLLVGFVFMYDGTLKDSDKTMAVNDTNHNDHNNNQIISEDKIVTEKGELSDEEAIVNAPKESKDLDTRNQNGPAVGLNELPLTERAEETTVVNGTSNLLAMSVAEESRVVSDEKLAEQEPYGYTNTVSPDQNFYRGDATSAKGSGTIVETKSDAPVVDLVLSGDLKKETEISYKSGEEVDGKKNEKTTVAPSDVSGNNGTVATTTVSNDKEKSDAEGEAYLTGSAGGVFGDTASEPESGKDLDSTLEADVPAKDFSLSQTKELRSLFFVVK